MPDREPYLVFLEQRAELVKRLAATTAAYDVEQIETLASVLGEAVAANA